MLKKAAWIIVIILWGFILTSSFFTRPEADDYCYAGVVQDIGVIPSIYHWHIHWTGSYSENLLAGIFGALEPFGARVAIPLFLSSFVLAWWYAFAHWYSRRDALFLSLAFGAALVMSRANDQPVYWISGLVNYWVPAVGIGLLIGALVRRRTLLALLTAIIFVAFSEVGGVLIIAGLGLGVLFWSGERRRLLIVTAGAGIGFLVTYLAPGTAIRQAALGPLELTLDKFLYVVLGSFATNMFFPMLFSIIPGLLFSGIGAILPPPVNVRRLPLIFLLLVLAASLLLAVMAALTSGWGLDLRSIYLLSALWLAQWYLLGAIIGQRFHAWGWITVIAGVVLIAFAGRHVIERADYAQRWDARHAAIIAGYRVLGDIGGWDSLTYEDWILSCAEAWYGHPIRFVDGGNVP